MADQPGTKQRQLGRWMILIVAAFFVLVYCYIAVTRMNYPYTLEWAEGGMLDHAARIMAGLDIYVRPSIDFTTFTYTPVYFYLSAGMSQLLGLSFFPLRLLSFIFSLGCFFILFRLVRQETGSFDCGMLAVALFAAAFPVCGAWYDLGRVDSLLLLFLLSGFYHYRFGRPTFAALFFVLAFFTKQTGLVIALPFVAYALLPSHIGRRWPFAAAFVVLLAGGFALLQHNTGGWFYYYIFYLPGLHALLPEQIPHFLLGYLLKPFPIALLIALLFLIRSGLKRETPQIYLLAGGAFIGGSLIAGVPFGIYHNVAMPAVAMVAILFGLGCHALLFGATSNRGGAGRDFIRGGAALLILMQFLWLVYNPQSYIPGEKDRLAGDALVQKIGQMPGRIFLPSHTYLLRLAHKESCGHFLALEDALRSVNDPRRVSLRQDIAIALGARKFDYVILDEPWFMEEITAHYEKQGELFSDPDRFWPLIGYRTRPQWVYRLK